MTASDGTPQDGPTDAERDNHIGLRPLRQIVKAIEGLEAAGRAEQPGDIAAAFSATVEVTTGESDADLDVMPNRLIGWLAPTENWWDFIPCVPQRSWSTKQHCWVSLDTLRAENVAERQEREGKAKDADTAT